MAQPSTTLAVDGFALHAAKALPLLSDLHTLADDLPQRGGALVCTVSQDSLI
ncbi:hypothetical protein [uncultured Sphingomonas sp.]|uniref:hypothetical protein n=1 Tax=uncultured Sphingomonas sp. TaxID=158754 RepID=UPI0026383AE4|nr:hypothetical protein [uncultured Sphingomonas sp.]